MGNTESTPPPSNSELEAARKRSANAAAFQSILRPSAPNVDVTPYQQAFHLQQPTRQRSYSDSTGSGNDTASQVPRYEESRVSRRLHRRRQTPRSPMSGNRAGSSSDDDSEVDSDEGSDSEDDEPFADVTQTQPVPRQVQSIWSSRNDGNPTSLTNTTRSVVASSSASSLRSSNAAFGADDGVTGDNGDPPKTYKQKMEYILNLAGNAQTFVAQTSDTTKIQTDNPFTYHAYVSPEIFYQWTIVKQLLHYLSVQPNEKILNDEFLQTISNNVKSLFKDHEDWLLAVDYFLYVQNIHLPDPISYADFGRLADLIFAAEAAKRQGEASELTTQQIQQYTRGLLMHLKQERETRWKDAGVAKIRSKPIYAEAVRMLRQLWNACNAKQPYKYRKLQGMDAVVAHLEHIATLSEQPHIPAAVSMPSVADRQMMHQIFGSMHANRLRHRHGWNVQSRGHDKSRRQGRTQSRSKRFAANRSVAKRSVSMSKFKSKSRQGARRNARRSLSPRMSENKTDSQLATMDGLLRQLSPRPRRMQSMSPRTRGKQSMSPRTRRMQSVSPRTRSMQSTSSRPRGYRRSKSNGGRRSQSKSGRSRRRK
jgi:hypothetical protein